MTLTFENVRVRYGGRRRGTTVVDGVDLAVGDGTIVGLVGESGSGKSTLARAAAGLLPVSSGRILLDGQPVRRGRLQMVFQDPYSSLDPRMTVGASIAEALPRGADRKAETARLLELVELEPARATMLPRELSGGQRQRIALARALAAKPDVVIADEITSALDVSIQGTVLNLVRDLHRRLGLSMLFISHDLAVVRYLADHLAVMYAGRIVEEGPADEVLLDPQHPYTRELLASALSTTDTAADAALEPAVADAEPADPNHLPSGCRFHPRCPEGPLVLERRDICRTEDPASQTRPHRAACHFAGAPVH